MPPQPKILIVDDEDHIRRIMSLMLTRHGYDCRTAASGAEALLMAGRERFAAVFTDLRMPGQDGLALLKKLKSQDPDLVVIVLTAFAAVETAIEAMKAGAYDYIGKPFKEEEITLVLEKSLERQRLVDENRRLRDQIRERFDFSNFIGQSAPMNKVFDIIAKVADTKTTVLILGESGTGKELAARSIHENSQRRDKPFVAINCGAIPANLLESEFFGHVKGAFTGADKAKKGLFAEADGGTLFLDEVSELPLDMQVKLLRALQEEEIRRIGDMASQKVDLRVLAAANKDLLAEVKAGRFREDLYYRLNVITLTMPPLRERPDDLPLLANHFLEQMVKKHHLGPKKLSPAALRLIAAQKWPGNVRALRNAMEQVAIISEGEIIGPGDLPFGPPPASPPGSASAPAAFRSGSGLLSLTIPEDWTDLKASAKEVAALCERLMIERAIVRLGGNRTKTAAHLGLSRRALIAKLAEYGLAEAGVRP